MDLPFLLTVDRPAWLGLLALIPALWWWGFHSLAGLGSGRRWTALLIRSVLILGLVLALAQARWQLKTDRLTVLYLLDQSQSIPTEVRQAMVDYVIREVETHRRPATRDRAGVIVFGAQAQMESAPYDGRLPLIGRLEATTDLDTSATNLEAALKLAQASFPEDSARRVVILSDGNENLGNAQVQARAMAADGIGIDVVPIELLATAEVSVDKVIMPSDARKDQEFETRVVITNQGEGDQPAEPVRGTLRLTRRIGQTESLVSEQQITLQPGKNILGIESQIDSVGMATTEATFVPDNPNQDRLAQNNQASAFTRISGQGKVLLIEDAFDRGEFFHLVQRLKANSIEVDVMDSANLYTSAAELLVYDAVILANLPRSSSDESRTDGVVGFSDAQIKMLVDNCEQLGCGIVMLGGDRSFGAGAWSNSLLEQAMPVDFQIKNKKVSAVGALAMVMHASEMPQGNYWQVKIGEAALDVLGPMDYCGVVDWSDMRGSPKWLWQMPNGVDRVFQNKQRMLRMIQNMQPGDMPEFQSAMRLMLQGLLGTQASMRHAIIISDGDPTPPTDALLKQFKDNNIKVSTVGVGTHGPASRKELERIAKATGGKYWGVTNPKALPKIYQREARRVAKPVIKEAPEGMSVVPVGTSQGHELLQGLDLAQLPPFYGYVMTTLKKNALVEQLAVSSQPTDDGGENSTLLATWRYGNGRTVAFTTDAGHKWAADWFSAAQYDKLFVQMIRYAMRPITESGTFTVSSEIKNGIARIVVTALDDKEEPLNFLEMRGAGLYSGGRVSGDTDFPLTFSQVGPGRYVAEHAVMGTGNLLFSIFPGEGYETLNAGLNIPYSTEFSDRQSNRRLLLDLAQLEPRGGVAGWLAEVPLTERSIDQLLGESTFRPTLTAAISVSEIWPLLLLLAVVVLFIDVFYRRVATGPWANALAVMLTVVAVLTGYFLFKWIRLSRSFEPDLTIWQNEPSQPLLVAILISLLGACFVAFGLSSEWVTEQVQRGWRKIRGQTAPAAAPSLSRLQSRKAEIEKSLESRRASTRFEPTGGTAAATSGQQQLEDVLASEIAKTPALPPKIKRAQLDDDQESSYTSRLLDAKRKLRERRAPGTDRANPDDDGPS